MPLSVVEISDPGPPKEPPPAAAPPPAADDDKDEEDMGMSDVLLDSVTRMEWKSIEASLSHHKKVVADMLKRACAQVRTKGELVVDESNGKFLGDMLPEMDNFSMWCYKVRACRGGQLQRATAEDSRAVGGTCGTGEREASHPLLLRAHARPNRALLTRASAAHVAPTRSTSVQRSWTCCR